MTVSPRSRFHQNPTDVRSLASLVKEEWFHRALEFALLQYQQKILTGISNGDASERFHCILGATEFKRELLNLSDTIVDRAAQAIGNLNHTV